MSVYDWVIKSISDKRRDINFDSFEFAESEDKTKRTLKGYFYAMDGAYSVAEMVLVGEGALKDCEIESMGVHGVLVDRATKKYKINKHFHQTMSAYYRYWGVLSEGVDVYQREDPTISWEQYVEEYREKFVLWLPRLFDMLYNLLYKYMLVKGETI